jgi:hypothetical protein
MHRQTHRLSFNKTRSEQKMARSTIQADGRDPGAMIYIIKFYKDWYRHSKVDGGWILGHTDSTEIA